MSRKPKEVFFVKRIDVRLSQEVHDKAKAILEDFPEDYNSISDVFRAGINALLNYKTKGGIK